MDPINIWKSGNETVSDISMDAVIEDGLRTLPLAQPPASLFNAVMTRIEERDPIVRPVFQISWMDFALSLFFAGMIGLGMLLTGWVPRQIWFPRFSAAVSVQMRWFQVLHVDWIVWAAIILSGVASVIALIVLINQWSAQRWDRL